MFEPDRDCSKENYAIIKFEANDGDGNGRDCFLPARGYKAYAMAFPSCVCVSHACFVSKRLNISSKLPPDSSIEGCCLTPTASPLAGAPNTRGEKIARFFTNKSVYLGNGARYGHGCYGRIEKKP